MTISIDRKSITVKSMYEREQPLPEGPQNIAHLEHLRSMCFGGRMESGIDKPHIEVVNWKSTT